MESSAVKSSEKTAIQTAQWAATAAAFAATGLAIGKLFLFWFTGSMVVALSAWDSCMDVMVSLINRKIIHFARQSADTEHPYGHGKAESIAAFAQGTLISGGALIIFVSSVQKLYHALQGKPEPTADTWFAVSFFVGASALSLLITMWLKHFGKRFSSPALLADSEHYRMDVVANIASAVSIACVLLTQKVWLDPLLACVFSIYIAFGGYKLLKESANDLMDREVPEEIKTEALSIVEATSSMIIDVHKFRGRRSGHRYFFDFHVTLPTALQFAEVHVIVEKIEDNLQSRFDADVVVHADPDILPEAELSTLALTKRPLLKT